MNKSLLILLVTLTFGGIAHAQSIPQSSPLWVSGSVITTTPLNTALGFQIPSLANQTCLGTNSSGTFGAGTCSGGGGSTGLSTTSPWVAGNTVYVADNGHVTSVATSTVSIGAGLSYSGTMGNEINGLSGTLSNTGVLSFNTRTGGVTLSSGDVTTALGFTPFGGTNPLPIPNGGTATTSAVTNGVYYYNGTNAEADNLISFNGSRLLVGQSGIGNVSVTPGTGNYGLVINGPTGSTASVAWGSGSSRQLVFGDSTLSAGTTDTFILGFPNSTNTARLAVNGSATSTPFALLSVAGSAGGTTPLFAISTSTAGFATTTALTIDQNGNLSIGSGAALLAPITNSLRFISAGAGVLPTGNGIATFINQTTQLLLQRNNTAGSNQICFIESTTQGVPDSTTCQEAIAANRTNLPASGDGELDFFTRANGNPGQVAVLSSVGYLGIGTTTPYAELSVLAGGAFTSQAASTVFTVSSSSAGTATSTFFNIDSSGNVSLPLLTGTQCLHEISGVVSGTGSDCGSGGAGVSSLQQTYGTAQTGALTLATTSVSFNGLTVANAITNSGGTFTITPLWSGFLNITGGGTNETSEVTNGVNYFDGTGITSGTQLVFNGTDLGVGSSSPANALLAVEGVNTTNPQLAIQYDNTNMATFQVGSTGILRIQSSANIKGIGFSTVGTIRFDVSGNSFISQIATGPELGNVDCTTAVAVIEPNQTNSTTGIGCGGGNQLNFFVAGAEMARIAANGSGFGTTTPFSELSVSTTTQSSPLTSLFAVASTTGATLFNVLGGGNVGVGTTSPWRTFSVNGTAALNGLTAGAGAGALCLTARGEVTYSSGAACTGGGASFTGTVGQFPYFSATNTLTATSSLFLATNNNIGIGSTTPWAALSVVGNLTTEPLFAIASSTTSGSNKPVVEYDQYGHKITSGKTPTGTLSGSPTGITFTGNDSNGSVTVSGGFTSAVPLVVTFANPFPTGSTVQCLFQNDNSGITGRLEYSSISTTGVTVVAAAGTVTNFTYECMASQ